MNDNLYELYTNKLNRCFTDAFADVYSSIKKKGKNKVLNFTECIYKRWYYSTFFEETVLSPSNLQYRLGEKCFKSPELNIPVFKPVSTKLFKGFNISFKKYTNSEHPIINDLKIFLENCSSEIKIDENNMISEDEALKVIDKLSIFDPFYLQYLLMISVKLKLIDKLPSIYSNVFHITNKRTSFYKRKNSEILNDIVYAAVDIASNNLDGFLPISKGLFNKDFIIQLIKEPISIDEIFKKIYLYSGINIEEIWNLEMEELDEMDSVILSSTYFMGIMLDKWFLTPFGHYLKFIQPMYILPYRFKEELETLCDDVNNGERGEFIATLYAPCSKYVTTVLAMDFFKVETRENFGNIFKKLSIECIIDSVLNDIKNNTYHSLGNLETEITKIYEIKIKDIEDKKYWKVLEIQGNKTLHSLFFEVCKMFGIDPYCQYSVFLDENFSLFMEYTSPNKTKRISKKTDKTFLSDLEFKDKQKLIFKINNIGEFPTLEYSDSVVMFELEVLSTKERIIGNFYPRVTRISKLAKEIEKDF